MTPSDDLTLLELRALTYRDDPVRTARVLNARMAAARRLTDWMRSWSPIVVPLVSWFDWDRLRVNVAHLVSPGLVQWK